MANLADNINRAIADFDNIKTAIEDKGVDVGNVLTSQYADKISQIESGGGEEVLYSIDGRCYTKNVELPNSVTSIGTNAFNNCTELVSLIIPESVTSINPYVIYGCENLRILNIPHNVVTIAANAFRDSGIGSVSLPNTLTSIGANAFYHCPNLTSITLEQNFNSSGANFSNGSYSVETMIAMMTALADLTGETAKTLTLGATNLAKLTAEQRQIATSKNWNLA